MSIDVYKEKYIGSINEVVLGAGVKSLRIGGQSCYPFYLFEGKMPNPPRIAMEILDSTPDNWPDALMQIYGGEVDNPISWARKCISDFNAEMIQLTLIGGDPNGKNRPVGDLISTVKEVIETVDIPIVVWGCGNAERDAEILSRIAETCTGKSLLLGPIEEKNYKQISPSLISNGHIAILSTPIDVNLSKQLNILAGNIGIPDEKIVNDPTIGALGYGLEYTYSVMERGMQAALVQNDEKLQYPIYCNMAVEIWKTKEAKAVDERMGDVEKRGMLMEAVSAITLFLAGAGVVVMRHPKAISLVKTWIEKLIK